MASDGLSTHTSPQIATPLLGGQGPLHVGLRHSEGLMGFGIIRIQLLLAWARLLPTSSSLGPR